MSPKTLVSLLVLALPVVPGSVGVIAADPAVTFVVTNNGLTSYNIDGSSNPTLDLVRGQTYTFQINATGHPFWIKTVQSTGTANAYSTGITGNGTESGTLTFTVPAEAPSTLFYDCQFHASMTGQINITGPTPTERMTWGRLKALF
jgi:hypothetical protein